MLQALDLLSLCLCCTAPRRIARRMSFPRPGAVAVHLKLRHEKAANVVRVDPWPFRQSKMDLTIPFRRVPARAYRDRRRASRDLASARSSTFRSA